MSTSSLFERSPFLKVIAGIENFDAESIRAVATAADGVADAIDLSADEAAVRWVKAHTGLSVFVSSLDPALLAQAVEWGTDWVELGNFQPIYDRGALINPTMVMDWTRQLQLLVQGRARICVTIPGILSVAEQVELARQIQAAGADLIQVENISGDLSHVAPIQAAVEIPVMLSGRLTRDNLSTALQTGAEGYGVGNAVRQAGDVDAMRAYINTMQQQLGRVAAQA
ncbi:MAG: DUF561 domain-containing protein [Candidatus Sericytochromatia bacterium]|nr:DUF561 domain-containing protein [Candidatus Sericytochromatia bacterium]